jgi:hypothetical protein
LNSRIHTAASDPPALTRRSVAPSPSPGIFRRAGQWFVVSAAGELGPFRSAFQAEREARAHERVIARQPQ